MAVFRCSVIFLTWLLFTVVLNSPNGNSGLDKKVCSIIVAKSLDVKHYPTRNSGPTRRFTRFALLPPSLKCMASLKLANVTLSATYFVLLAGDIQQNPGPAIRGRVGRVLEILRLSILAKTNLQYHIYSVILKAHGFFKENLFFCGNSLLLLLLFY